ncbi:MAG: hypothetical protein Q4G16_04240 [Cruoricaptor ignavus]|nr:hypothetical protein [Cruoricaptor ignavus]
MRLEKWLKFSVFNLVIVAFLGVIMRYKILFYFPWIDQKHTQEAHSHFAFYGWVTCCIYVLVVRYLQKNIPPDNLGKYKTLLVGNVLASFGMLLTFLYGGYFWLSIVFSTLALLVSFAFFFFLLKDLKNIQEPSKIWFLAGLFFAVLSSLGVFFLAYMKVSGTLQQDWYLASTYYYLHFQYNGFFIFSCIGLLLFSLKEIGVQITQKQNKTIFWSLFLGCVIGFGLSVLWLELPLWLLVLVGFATVIQTFGVFQLYQFIKNNWAKIKGIWSPLQRFIFIYVGFAFLVKTLLQLLSIIPEISQFAFGFRNVVVAYLHLVLLMCISAFLLSQVLVTQYFKTSKYLQLGIGLFLFGVFLNEAVLGIMGIFSISYIPVPFSAHWLLGASVIIFISVILIFSQLKKNKIE